MAFTVARNHLVGRVNIPSNASSPPGLIQANTQDPFNQSSQYGLIWIYFGSFFLLTTSAVYYYHAVTDRIRVAIREENIRRAVQHYASAGEARWLSLSDESLHNVVSSSSERSSGKTKEMDDVSRSGSSFEDVETGRHRLCKIPSQNTASTIQLKSTPFWRYRVLNISVALFRCLFYRPAVEFTIFQRRFESPSLATLFIVLLATAMCFLYAFLVKPLFWQSMAFGSPPLSVRAGMMAVAMTPWIVATSTKVNLVSVLTGIGHERLNRLHRWGGYLCMALSIVHAVPFFVQSVQDPVGFGVWQGYFQTNGLYIFATGLAALTPLAFLSLHSLPVLRRVAYELFVTFHVPIATVYIAMLFWHTKNFLASWSYLYVTIAIWTISSLIRLLFYLNWTNFLQRSFIIGNDASVTILAENTVKVTISTQKKWKPGQYVYLRIPSISTLQNHPFTISSLCSDDLPSAYGEDYRDMVLLFRPFGGFTKQMAEVAKEKGPYHIHRALIDGPYGGLKRKLESFDTVILVAGGSGITAIVSHLLDLIKRMREGKAITQHVNVIWAMKRPETLDWFREELRICRSCAPPGSVRCQFFITAAKPQRPRDLGLSTAAGFKTQSAIRAYFRDQINDTFQEAANKKTSFASKRSSGYIKEVADGDKSREKELRDENEDLVSALPTAYFAGAGRQPRSPESPDEPRNFSLPGSIAADPSQSVVQASPVERTPMIPSPAATLKRPTAVDLALDIPSALSSVRSPSKRTSSAASSAFPSSFPTTAQDTATAATDSSFDFGFPGTPTEFQKSLMRFAFIPAADRGDQANDSWTSDYGRPDLPLVLKDIVSSSVGETVDGRRVCIFVCGPPSMRIAVSNTVAQLQSLVFKGGNGIDEVFLHTENYAL